MNKKLLNIKLLNVNYIQFYKLHNIPLIELNNIEDFVEYISLKEIKIVGVQPEMERFIIVDSGVAYSIGNGGYLTIEDYLEGIDKYSCAKEYYREKEYESVGIKEPDKYKELGFKNEKDYIDAYNLGYLKGLKKLYDEKLLYEDKLTGNNYISYYGKNGFIDETIIENVADIYYFSKKQGFKNFEELLNSLKLGFGDSEDYNIALKKNFNSAEEYYISLEEGYDNPEDYHISNKLKIDNKESYELYEELLKIKNKYQLKTFEEAMLYNIIFKMKINSKITIKEMWHKLRNDEKIKPQEKKKINVLLKDKEKLKQRFKPIEYVQEWYSLKFKSIDELRNYILNNDFIMNLITYDKNNDSIEKYNRRIFSERFIIVDNHELTLEQLKLLKLKLNKLKFEVAIFAEESKTMLYKSNSIYTIPVSSKECINKMIINYVKGFGLLVITNNTFGEYRTYDNWVKENIDKHIINYKINKDNEVEINTKDLLKKTINNMITK